jgi:hypothetical protein
MDAILVITFIVFFISFKQDDSPCIFISK